MRSSADRAEHIFCALFLSAAFLHPVVKQGCGFALTRWGCRSGCSWSSCRGHWRRSSHRSRCNGRSRGWCWCAACNALDGLFYGWDGSLHGALHHLASTTASASQCDVGSVKPATSACLGCLNRGLSGSASGHGTGNGGGTASRGKSQQATDGTGNVANRKAWWDGVLFLVNRRAQDEVALGVLACLQAGKVGLQDLHGLLWVCHQSA